jgi:hypothetical protein
MKTYAVRRINSEQLRTWSRNADVITLTVALPSTGYVVETVQFDLNEIAQLAAPPKNARTQWSARLANDKKLAYLNIFAETYISKTPTKQFLSFYLSYAVLVVPTAVDAVLGISVSEDDDVSMLGLDGVLTAEEWSALVATAYPDVTLQGTETADGLALTATITKGGAPYSMPGVDLYWEATAGVLSRTRTLVEGNTATNILKDGLPDSKVKVGFRFFTGAAELVI